MCKYGAYAIFPGNESSLSKNVNMNCSEKKLSRTEVADYYWCNIGGPPKGQSGWYPGRGY